MAATSAARAQLRKSSVGADAMEIALGIPTIADSEDTALTDWRRIDDAAAQRGVGQKQLSAKGRDQDVHLG
ncbi:hypothetical protein [Bradyrhizobium zhanjiangense]|uniref:hypothetical protein n=1 Tax=Bradyrhizobium zhanjiangense TaxID=1325107 RepID=UPI00100888D7|nr:hypothetical protein [Bradyrhizobium zhanjiangense]